MLLSGPAPAWALLLITPSFPPLPSAVTHPLTKKGAGGCLCTHIWGLASLFTTRGPEYNHQLSGIFQEGYVHTGMHTHAQHTHTHTTHTAYTHTHNIPTQHTHTHTHNIPTQHTYTHTTYTNMHPFPKHIRTYTIMYIYSYTCIYTHIYTAYKLTNIYIYIHPVHIYTHATYTLKHIQTTYTLTHTHTQHKHIYILTCFWAALFCLAQL